MSTPTRRAVVACQWHALSNDRSGAENCDTLTAIAGSMAEAFYGIPALLTAECRDRIPEDMLNVLNRFDAALGRNRDAEEAKAGLKDNHYHEKAISIFYEASTKENLVQILAVISRRMEQQGQFIAAVEPLQAVFDLFPRSNKPSRRACADIWRR